MLLVVVITKRFTDYLACVRNCANYCCIKQIVSLFSRWANWGLTEVKHLARGRFLQLTTQPEFGISPTAHQLWHPGHRGSTSLLWELGLLVVTPLPPTCSKLQGSQNLYKVSGYSHYPHVLTYPRSRAWWLDEGLHTENTLLRIYSNETVCASIVNSKTFCKNKK